MFGITGLSARIAVLGIVSAILFGIGYYACYHISYLPERDAYTKFVAQTEQIGKDQSKITDATNLENERKLKNAEKNTVDTAIAIADYWKHHPVIRVRYTSSGGCTLSKATGNPENTDGTASIGYVSAFSQADTEQVANRLDQLQKLLIRYGVTVQ